MAEMAKSIAMLGMELKRLDEQVEFVKTTLLAQKLEAAESIENKQLELAKLLNATSRITISRFQFT